MVDCTGGEGKGGAPGKNAQQNFTKSKVISTERLSLEFCDFNCRFASWPKDEALDGSGSCRTFQAIFCKKKNRPVHKNAPCPDKEKAHRGDLESVEKGDHK
jgi:hypothetical protein